MINIGDKVKILEPFKYHFSDVYEVKEIIVHENGDKVYMLDDIGGFDQKFLEKIS